MSLKFYVLRITSYNVCYTKLLRDEIVSVVEAVDRNEVIGFGIYHFNDENVVIDYVESNNDEYLYDGIVRSILFLAINNNIDNAIFNIQNTNVLKNLGFISESSNCLQNITEFMNKFV